MTELDEELPELVLELIEEFGAEVSYRFVEGSEYNPETSSSSSAASPPITMKALIEDYNLQASGQAFEAGLIKAGDKKLTMAAASFSKSPSPGDRVKFNGDLFNVVNVKTVYSGQLAALHEIQGRT